MRSLVAAACAGFALLACGAASAATIEVRDAWIRATAPGAPTAAGYATLINHGVATDRLMGGRAGVAGAVEVHEMSMAGGIMRMRPIPGGLGVGASATVKLSPNGDHLMLIGLKRPLRAGEHVKVVLQFRRAGDVTADFAVRDAAPGGGMHM